MRKTSLRPMYAKYNCTYKCIKPVETILTSAYAFILAAWRLINSTEGSIRTRSKIAAPYYARSIQAETNTLYRWIFARRRSERRRRRVEVEDQPNAERAREGGRRPKQHRRWRRPSVDDRPTDRPTLSETTTSTTGYARRFRLSCRILTASQRTTYRRRGRKLRAS